jgi:hypothetical protein
MEETTKWSDPLRSLAMKTPLKLLIKDNSVKAVISDEDPRYCSSHHAEGLVDLNLMNKKTVTGFRYPRACRFRKYQFENRSWELPLPTFFKTFFLLHKLWLKLAKLTKNEIFLNVIILKRCVPRPEKRENSRKKFENRSIVANFSLF